MKNKHAIFPIVMSGLAFLCFLFIVFCMSTYVQPLWGKTMVLLLPSLILALVAILAFKGKLDSRKTKNLTAVLSVLLVVTSFVYTLVLSVETSIVETTDVKFYERACKVVGDEEGVTGIFPEKIPADAENIVFRYFPGFLQGAEYFELSYNTTAKVLSDWELFLENKAQWIGSNVQWHEENNFFFSGEDSVRYQLYWEGDWNHNEQSYVLIDQLNNRITFYYENG